MTRRLPLLPLLMLAACPAPDRPPAAAVQEAARPAAPVRVEDFARFRWIEGTWRGTGGGVDAFFERYSMIDDSTLIRYTFSDSTLSAISDSTPIGLRGGRVLDPTEDPDWQVTAFDSTSWRFEHLRDPGRAFTWRGENPATWTAHLESPQGARTYTLTRIPNP
jgi:hypothetical protein